MTSQKRGIPTNERRIRTAKEEHNLLTSRFTLDSQGSSPQKREDGAKNDGGRRRDKKARLDRNMIASSPREMSPITRWE